MAITGVTREEFENFFKDGGKLTFTIDAEDISPDKSFEKFELIEPFLKTGFEINPISNIAESAKVAVFDDGWFGIWSNVYLSNGNVIFKQLDNGKYEALCEIK